jgi:TolB-like protein
VSSKLRFDGWVLDPESGDLERAGRRIHLPEQPVQLLQELIAHAGSVVTREQLIALLWPKGVVDFDTSLNTLVRKLRGALGDPAETPRYIETLPRRGYRFIGTLDPDPEHGSSPATHATGSPRTARRTSIAVLPLANLTPDPEKEYFGDGVADELINMLTRVPGLKVLARTSSFAYRGRQIDVRQIARDLGVDALLEGSVRSAGDRIRLSAQLVDGQSGYHLWSQSYERGFDDLFALQDELASAIVQAIRDTLNSSVDTVTQSRPTEDLEAYQLYLRGRALMERGTEENIQRAVELLRQAVARDPTFARAYGAMALAHWVAFYVNYPVADALGEAEREAERALAIDPQLAEAHGVLGTVYSARLEWLKADASLRAAWSLAENDAFTRSLHGVHVGLAAGHLRQAEEEIGAAHRLAPADALVALQHAIVLLVCGSRDAEVIKYTNLGVDLGFPKNLAPVPFLYAVVALRGQRYAEAAEILAQNAPAVRLALNAPATGGETEHAVAALTAVDRADPRKLVSEGVGWLPMLYTRLGALDRAYEAAHCALDERERIGPVWMSPATFWFPEMQPFRQDPRFQALVTRLGLMQYWEKYGPPDNCELRDGRLICH